MNNLHRFYSISSKNKVLKIIIVGPAYPLRGGIANFNEALCRTFLELGYDSEIVSFSMQYPGWLFPGKTQLAEGDPPPDGLSISPLINSVNPFSWKKTANYIVSREPDLLVIRYWMPFMAPCLGTISRWVKNKRNQTKIVAVADNIVPHEKRPGDSMLTKYFVNGCDEFVVMSKSVLQDLKLIDFTKPAKLLPHPVYDIFGKSVSRETARAKLNLGNEKLVLFFGFIRHYKGLDLLINAFADEHVKKSGAKLIVAGEFYEDKKPYYELVEKLGLKDTVIFHDHYIPRDEVKNYFCASDLVVQPYRDATQSGVTQIAYHFVRPMVVTDVGGLSEIVPDGKAGYVVDPDPEKIASAIADFFANNKASALESGVREMAKQFTWEAFASGVVGR